MTHGVNINYGSYPLNLSQAAEEQLAWLEETLSNSKADWVIVCGHYPVFSGGEHGNTATLQAKVRPLLEKYEVMNHCQANPCSRHMQRLTSQDTACPTKTA